MSVRAIYEYGVFRPLEPCEVAEGDRIELVIVRRDEAKTDDDSSFDATVKLDRDAARRRAMELLNKGWDLGGKPLSRDEAHER